MDTSQYMSMFLEEAMENLQTLNDSLLQLEQEPEDSDKLNEIFRVAHTLKGMSATMGFNEIAELTHKMEDVLSEFRDGELKVTENVVTVLFKCLDTLEQMVNNIADDIDEEISIEGIISELQDIKKSSEKGDIKEKAIEEHKEEIALNSDSDLNLNEYDKNIMKQAKNKGYNTYIIKVILSENTLLKSARAFLIFKSLEDVGEIVKSEPSAEDIESENFDFEINLMYVSKENEKEIYKILSGISEVEEVMLHKLEEEKIIEESKEHTASNLDLDLNEYDINVVKQAEDKGFDSYAIKVVLNENTLLKSARAFLIFKNLEDSGEIVKSIPSVEDIERENFDFEINLMYISNRAKEEIYEILSNISEVEQVMVDNVNVEKEREKIIKAEEKVVAIKEKVQQEKSKVDVKSVQNNKPRGKKEHQFKKQHQSVRVDLGRLDKFMNMVSELVINRTRLEQISQNYKLTELNETLEQVARTTSDLQDLVMKIRMLPLDIVFNRFPRLIRDLSVELDKEMELIIKGQDTELDRTVIDEIGEPLIHLIRNAADHGIEPTEERIKKGKNPVGKIKLLAYQEGTKAVIKVEDDGGGIDVQKVRAKANRLDINTEGMTDNDIRNLIFMQGFSTNEKVTDISGRGVGMDVVKTKIASLGGSVEVISEENKGSSFIIRLPLTLQIIQALLVKVGEETMAISLGYIDRVIDFKEDLIKKTNNKEVIIYNENVIPLIRLSKRLNLEESNSKKKYIVIVKVGEKNIGLVVDSLLGQQEIVIKPLGKTLQGLKEYIGATILGDGLVTLILDVSSLV
ncbi:chemotaxis protein CheA [Clostridium tetani]|uniref:chemotaxis protein CheA n=1 Tax=Clostridium tetani TaxID=1513 RepID=UPI0005143C56|nr:chemotaxis protein CheA [Clostridium tetani]KGI39698.1 chemotaxis protein CheA [Clostridium tetani ATCC 9441]QBD85216.1 chemotaxis protein CheA [Clostridium tetani]RXI61927.1 chemotaxis protein CheA [Clostridium tetani]RXI63971.1 chemotaxis protein CheA [Clostridium tetani]RXI65623.1 chemotaxis protein CheA [Clostridium tetani]